MVASTPMPIDPMAFAGYAPGVTSKGPGWVRVFEVPTGAIVIESGSRLRVRRGGPRDQWMVTGRGEKDRVALVAVDDQWNTFRTVDIAKLLRLNPALLDGLEVGTETVASSDDTQFIRLTRRDDAEHEVSAATFVRSHIEELRQRTVLLVDVG